MVINYENVLLRHNKSVCPSRSSEFTDVSARLGNHTFKVPVCMSNMPAVQTWDILKQFDSNNWFYVRHRIDGPDKVFLFAKSANEEFNVTSISVGVGYKWIQLIIDLYADKINVDFFTIDVALSYNDNIIPVVKTIKKYHPNATLIVGNGASGKWIKWLEKLGVNCAKVGIGVSEACRTRQFTGFGSSTISSVRECSRFANRTSIARDLWNDLTGQRHSPIVIMSDGGIRVNKEGVPFIGDIARALVAGQADWVMSGSLFRNCSDSPAMQNGYFGNASADGKGNKKHVEGRNVSVQSNGHTTKEMMNLIEESLRSSVSYSGGRNIKEMKELTTWELV